MAWLTSVSETGVDGDAGEPGDEEGDTVGTGEGGELGQDGEEGGGDGDSGEAEPDPSHVGRSHCVQRVAWLT